MRSRGWPSRSSLIASTEMPLVRNKDAVLGLASTKEVAQAFHVSIWTVRRWVREGRLHPRQHRINGYCIQYLFEDRDLCAFLTKYFPLGPRLPAGKERREGDRDEEAP